MKSFLTLLCCLLLIPVLTYAGVGVVTPEIEARALALWNRFCSSSTPQGGTDGGSYIYCKISQDNEDVRLQHNVELPQGPQGSQEQVIFVQPPAQHYTHNVVVSGGRGSQPRTVIYVKPSKNTHEVNIKQEGVQEGGGAVQKPQLFFLKGDHNGGTPR